MYKRLTAIDSSVMSDHCYLTDDDTCYFFGEYTARRGYSHSYTNQLISNLKKGVDLRGTPQYQYKLRTIRKIAEFLNIIGNSEDFTFIPIPSSKRKDDPLYDDRLVRILEAYKSLNSSVDYRELVTQQETTRASHECTDGNRLTVDELEEVYAIEDLESSALRPTLIIFDDMITTGSHFKAMQSILSQRFPDHAIIGLFISRRVPETIDPCFVVNDAE